MDLAFLVGRSATRAKRPASPSRRVMGRFFGRVPGGTGKVGLAYVTEIEGGQATRAKAKRPALAGNRLESTYAFRAKAGQRYRLTQLVSVVCGVMHHHPDQHAARMAAKAKFDGFESIRAENRAAWEEIWKGRIRLIGAGDEWQASG